jgi:hypothetical protein
MALLVASLFNLFVYSTDDVIQDINTWITLTPATTTFIPNNYEGMSLGNLTSIQIANLDQTRKVKIPALHALLMFTTAISGAQRLQWDGLKQFMNFFGMLMYVYLILKITNVMMIYPRPMEWSTGKNHVALSATFMWF